MAEYISRDKVLSYVYATHSTGGFKTEEDYLWLQEAVVDAATSDVQSVKRGKWCPPLMGQGKFATYCSMCQYTVMRNAAGIFEETPFCPHCGADMRGEQNDD